MIPLDGCPPRGGGLFLIELIGLIGLHWFISHIRELGHIYFKDLWQYIRDAKFCDQIGVSLYFAGGLLQILSGHTFLWDNYNQSYKNLTSVKISQNAWDSCEMRESETYDHA